jgi:hypothetical protein
MRNFGGLLLWCPKGTAKLVPGPLLGPSGCPHSAFRYLFFWVFLFFLIAGVVTTGCDVLL